MAGSYVDKNFPGSKPTIVTNNYPDVEGIDYDKFILTSDGMDESTQNLAFEEFSKYIHTQKENFLGYQVNQNLNPSLSIPSFLESHINNVGDPFQSGNFTVNSKIAERAVLDYFASLWNAKWPHHEINEIDENVTRNDWQESYWGYLLSMGSSEGNIYALWNARDYLAGKILIKDTVKNERHKKASQEGKPCNAAVQLKEIQAKFLFENGEVIKRKYDCDVEVTAYTPIAFYSENTHYSIIKNIKILKVNTFYEEAEKMKFDCPLVFDTDDYPENYSPQYISENGWPYDVPSNDDGSIYIPALVKLVEFFAKRGYPPLISYNFGTTFKGALDDVEKAAEALVPVLKKYNLYERTVLYEDQNGNAQFDIRTGFWMHVDGALGAAYVPFLKKAYLSAGEEANAALLPNFDFSIPEVHSITMSGHKWIGTAWPCGILMTKVKYQLLPVVDPSYIGSSDTTFSGSRNGFSALLLWDYISNHSVEQLSLKAKKGIDLALYFIKKFKEVEEIHGDLWLEHSPNAITVRFKKANEQITYKYSLSSESLYVNGKQRDYSHIFFMDSVSKDLLDRFIDDLKSPDAFTVPVDDIAKVGLGMGFK